MKDEAENSDDDQSADTEMRQAEASAASAIVFNVTAASAGCPIHGG